MSWSGLGINKIKSPLNWNSAHKPIEYEFELRNFTLQATNNGGKVQLFTTILGYSGALTYAKLVFIPSGIYQGLHRVIQVLDSQTIVIDLDYVSNQSLANCKVINNPKIDIYIGYRQNEQYPIQLPYTKIATVELIFNPSTFRARLDLSGYVSPTFNIIDTAVIGIDFSRFNVIRIGAATGYQAPLDYFTDTRYYVLNSAINSDLLNFYVNNNLYLTHDGNAHVSSCGFSFASNVQGNTVFSNFFESGEIAGEFEAAEFDNQEFNT
jgi:hypothetical protein